jgi:hypothetical protein
LLPLPSEHKEVAYWRRLIPSPRVKNRMPLTEESERTL